MSNHFVFALVSDDPKKLHPILARVFTDPWVASYQIGFGPPLVRASDRLIERTKTAKSALEKLEAYLECCFFEEHERQRLFALFRRLVVRQEGAVEAEALDEKSADVLDLSLRLHYPSDAPEPIRSEMIERGVDGNGQPKVLPPEALTGRFRVKLGDPRNARLLAVEAVRKLASDPERALALELRVPVGVRSLYAAFLSRIAAAAVFRVAEIGEPVSHART